MSVERAEYVAIFAEHKPFYFEKAREAVEKAGFSYKGMELVARGRVVSGKREDGTTEWLLKDLQAGMTLRLIEGQEGAVFGRLVEAVSSGALPDMVQVRGRVVETSTTSNTTEQTGAQLTLILTTFESAEKAVLPPLIPTKSIKKKKTKDNGWY